MQFRDGVYIGTTSGSNFNTTSNKNENNRIIIETTDAKRVPYLFST